MFRRSVLVVGDLGSALRAAGTKLRRSFGEIGRRNDDASNWIQHFVAREVERRVAARDAAPRRERVAGATREQRASAASAAS
jgi:hypothetical protein